MGHGALVPLYLNAFYLCPINWRFDDLDSVGQCSNKEQIDQLIEIVSELHHILLDQKKTQFIPSSV